MDFSVEGYKGLLGLLKENRYKFADYHNWENEDRCVILRHDIDNNIQDAYQLAKIEYEEGVTSTFFILVTSDMYNVFSASSRRSIKAIQNLGHEIGLHFDEQAYERNEDPPAFIVDAILQEAALLSEAIGSPVTTVSMHRPSLTILDSDLVIPGMVNSYGKTFFKDFKYLSDSRMRWREPVKQIVREGNHDRLHILTHAFWYKDKPMKKIMSDFIDSASSERCCAVKDNFSNFEEVFTPEELSRWS